MAEPLGTDEFVGDQIAHTPEGDIALGYLDNIGIAHRCTRVHPTATDMCADCDTPVFMDLTITGLDWYDGCWYGNQGGTPAKYHRWNPAPSWTGGTLRLSQQNEYVHNCFRCTWYGTFFFSELDEADGVIEDYDTGEDCENGENAIDSLLIDVMSWRVVFEYDYQYRLFGTFPNEFERLIYGRVRNSVDPTKDWRIFFYGEHQADDPFLCDAAGWGGALWHDWAGGWGYGTPSVDPILMADL